MPFCNQVGKNTVLKKYVDTEKSSVKHCETSHLNWIRGWMVMIFVSTYLQLPHLSFDQNSVC